MEKGEKSIKLLLIVIIVALAVFLIINLNNNNFFYKNFTVITENNVNTILTNGKLTEQESMKILFKLMFSKEEIYGKTINQVLNDE